MSAGVLNMFNNISHNVCLIIWYCTIILSSTVNPVWGYALLSYFKLGMGPSREGGARRVSLRKTALSQMHIATAKSGNLDDIFDQYRVIRTKFATNFMIISIRLLNGGNI